MATLVLSTAGSAIAGPIGGMLGSLVGQGIDQQLLGGGPRKGPRLGDLSVQTSSYGTPIPRIYGTMRVAGTIVWSTELQENSELQGDGKSQPETVVYTYSVSFAVALSSRPASRIKRIWADGKLIRGAAGDMKVPGTLRFYPGSEDQIVDPFIASEEGIGEAPAYRGLALAVFEDLQLGDFGNRIPALTFELVADEGDGIGIGALIGDASGGAVDCADGRTVGGYAAYGDNAGAAIAPLVEAFAIELRDDGDKFRVPATTAVLEPSTHDLGASADIADMPPIEREQAPAGSLPASLALTYYDPARDFQTGQARVSVPGSGRIARVLALPCVLNAGQAKSMAESLLLRAFAIRERVTLRLPPSYIGISPGARLRLPGATGCWVAEDVEVERLVVAATLRPEWALAGERTADPGRPATQPDVIAAPTRLALFDLPDPATEQPTLVLAAASPSGAWTPVPVEIAAGGTYSASRSAPGEAKLGSALNVLGPGQPFLFDLVNHLDVELANADQWLQSRDSTELAMGANAAMVGDELIQFGEAEPIAPGRFRLSRLLRGRRGSEWAISAHMPGEDFVLVEQRSLKPILLPIEMLGTEVSVAAHGPGDGQPPPSVSRIANGEAMRPLSPALLKASFNPDGSIMISWVRRSRLAWGWADEVEAPEDPALQGFRVKVTGSAGGVDTDAADPGAFFSAAQVAALGAGPLTIEVRQIGALALSRPAILTINP